MPLKYKLIVLFLTIELAFFVPIVAFYYNIEKSYNEKVFDQNAKDQSRILIQAIKTPMIVNDVATLDDICKETLKQGLITGITIFNSSGKKLAFLDKNETTTKKPYSIVAPIELTGSNIGKIVINFDYSEGELEFTNSFLKLALTVLIGVFLASFIAALLITSLIERKLNEFGEDGIFEDISGNDAISNFAKRFIQMTTMAKEKSAKLEEFNSLLEIEVAKAQEKTKTQERVLAQQSKMAAMGEMIGAIAHQWRQPLNQLSAEKDLLIDDYFFQELTDEKVIAFQNKFNDILLYMSTTIDDFRNFFMPSKAKIEFDVYDCLRDTINIISGTLKNAGITLSVANNEQSVKAFGYPNEFSQVIINLINNAKDAIVLNNIKNGKIKIDIMRLNDTVIIETSDNAGGIPDDILEKIFEPYFTTKFASSGTGLGLYMSKNIIEKSMDGDFFATNRNGGAVFIIKLKIKDEQNG